MLKKIFVFITVMTMLGMASCTTTLNSSKTKDFGSSAITATFADLVVSPRKITYTYKPSDDVRRGGVTNVINTAMQTTVKKTGRRNVSEVTVSGYPATYKNFRSADDETLKDALKLRAVPEEPVIKKRFLGIF